MCCCDEERTDNVAKWTLFPFISFICFVIVLGTLGFVALFIGNMTYWNAETFVNIAEMNVDAGYLEPEMMVFQVVIALALIVFLIPLFACCLLLIAGCLDRERELPNGMDSLKRSVSSLPGVRGTRGYNKKKKRAGEGSDYNTVPMSAYPDPNYDVYN